MSSLNRRISKRILKRAGYTRQTHKVTDHGVVRLKKGEGNIIRPDGSDTGSRRWPKLCDTNLELTRHD